MLTRLLPIVERLSERRFDMGRESVFDMLAKDDECE